MAESPIFTPCGLICDDCEYFKGVKEPKCPGCVALKGKPFWGDCPTFACAAEHGIEHCGICEEFPCDKFIGMYDPAHGPASAVLRAGLLAYRARHGDSKAVDLSRNISH